MSRIFKTSLLCACGVFLIFLAAVLFHRATKLNALRSVGKPGLINELNKYGYTELSSDTGYNWEIDLDGSGVPRNLVVDIGTLGKIRSANLAHNLQIDDDTVAGLLNSSQGIINLYVEKTSVRGDCLTHATNVDQIKRLYIGGYTIPKPGDWLKRLHNINELSITNADITLDVANQLIGHSTLQKCLLIGCTVSPEARKVLQGPRFQLVDCK